MKFQNNTATEEILNHQKENTGHLQITKMRLVLDF